VSEKSLNLVTATAENTDSHDSDHARTYATWSSVIFRPNVGSGRHGVALQLLNRAAWGSSPCGLSYSSNRCRAYPCEVGNDKKTINEILGVRPAGAPAAPPPDRNPAEWMYERIARQIIDFEKRLSVDEEVGGRFVAAPREGDFRIKDTDYLEPRHADF
jgi:hypothetical protein